HGGEPQHGGGPSTVVVPSTVEGPGTVVSPSTVEGPSTVVSPSVEVGPSASAGPCTVSVTCGTCGGSVSQETLIQGKFCSLPCAQPTSGRESQAVKSERLGKRVRKKRKIYMDSGDEEADNHQEEEEEKAKASKGRRAAKLARLVTAPPNKKRAWSWPAYLEEEKAVAAPVKLFKE
ncbi:hypothetical protein CRUP_034931, partial [Coryphaenoides rupestris]